MPAAWPEKNPRLVAAYEGSAAGAGAIGPALQTLWTVLPQLRRVLLCPAGLRLPEPVARLVDHRIDVPSPGLAASSSETALSRLEAAFDVAAIFNEPGHTPCTAAYLCCLAGIPVRLGFEREFAGGLLTERWPPPGDDLPDERRHLRLVDRLVQYMPYRGHREGLR